VSDPWDPALEEFKPEPGDDNATLLVKIGFLCLFGFWLAFVARMVLFLHHPYGGRTAYVNMMYGGLAGGVLFAGLLALGAVIAR
jgi:hypothetical protein